MDTEAVLGLTGIRLAAIAIGVVVAIGFGIAIATGKTGTCRALYRQHPILFLTPLLLLNLSWVLKGNYPFAEFFGVPFLEFEFLGLAFSITTHFLLLLVLTPLAITVHVMLTHAIVRGTLGAGRPVFAGWGRRFASILCAYLSGTFVPLVALGLAMLVVAMTGELGVMLAIGAGIVIGLAVNFFTCTWFAVMVAKGVGWWRGLKQSAAFAKENLSAIVLPVLVQLLLMGFVVFYSITVTKAKPGQTNIQQKMNFKVNVCWVLGMDEECRWYNEIADAAEENKPPVVSYGLETLMILIAAFFLSKYSLIYLERTEPVDEDMPALSPGSGFPVPRVVLLGGLAILLAGGAGAIFLVKGSALPAGPAPANMCSIDRRWSLGTLQPSDELARYIRSEEFILAILRRNPKYAPLIPEAANFWQPRVLTNGWVWVPSLETGLDASYQPLFNDLRGDICAELDFREGLLAISIDDPDVIRLGLSRLDAARKCNPLVDLVEPVEKAAASRPAPIRTMLEKALEAARKGESLEGAAIK